MPLPAESSVWPPEHLALAFAKFNEHDAWYCGDVPRLMNLYSNETVIGATHSRNGEAYSGGIISIAQRGLSRMFWGRRLDPRTTRTALHVPLAADVSTMVSDSLWAEPAEFSAAIMDLSGDRVPADDATQSRLDLIANSPDAQMMYNEAGELVSALGGTYYATEWNVANTENVYVVAHDADTAIPTWSAGHLQSVIFWTSYVFDDELYRHLELHEVGAITHGLYRGGVGELGLQVPLNAIEETSWLTTPAQGKIIDGMQVTLQTGIKRLTVAFQPNVRKNRDYRKLGGGLSMLGRSDYAGVEPELNALDETWSSLMRDLKVARSRIFVDESLMKNRGAGQGASFDEEQEVYTILRSLAAPDGKTIDAQQFDIRVEEHTQLALELTKVVLRNAGLGSRDYEEQNGGDLTATGELMADKREETSRDKRIRYATAATTYINSVALELDGILFPGMGGKPDVLVGAEFPATQQQDPLKEAQIIGLLNAAGAIALKTKIKRANPDWDDDRVDEEAEQIQAEAPATPVMPTFPLPKFGYQDAEQSDEPFEDDQNDQTASDPDDVTGADRGNSAVPIPA